MASPSASCLTKFIEHKNGAACKKFGKIARLHNNL